MAARPLQTRHPSQHPARSLWYVLQAMGALLTDLKIVGVYTVKLTIHADDCCDDDVDAEAGT
jgi:hypothetical protein